MNVRIQIIALILSIAITGMIFELVRKRRLREEYSLLWLVAGVSFLVLSMKRSLVESLSRFMGIAYAPSALFVLALFFGMVLCLHFSLVLSRLSERSKVLTQQNALMEQRLKDLEDRLSGKESEASASEESRG